MENVENEYPMVVAMWGPPCTGKTTIAKGIAAKLKCPLMSFEYYLDQVVSLRSISTPPYLFPSIFQHQRSFVPYYEESMSSFKWTNFSGDGEWGNEVATNLPDLFCKLDNHPNLPKVLEHFKDVQKESNDHEDASVEKSSADVGESMAAKQLMDRAFTMVVQVAETHLRMGVSVIIDSVVLHAYLKKLTVLKTSHPGVKMVVVACQPSERTKWEHMFSIRKTSSDRNKWYKPGNPAYFGILSHYYALTYDFPRASILDVNTSDAPDYANLVQVLKDLCCSKGHSVKLNEWKPIHYTANGETDKESVECPLKIDRGRLPYDDATHGMLDLYTNLPKSLQRTCGACAQQVTNEEAYTCRCGCDLVLHKQCAHSTKREYHTPDSGMDLHSFSKLLQERWLGPEYSFPGKHICEQCKKDNKEFSYDCTSCFSKSYRTYFRELGYHGEGCSKSSDLAHNLYVEAKRIPQVNSYKCAACGKPGSFSGYSCFHCRIHYHVGCVSLPDSIQHVHGRWDHPMKLHLSTPDDEEGYVCDVCYRNIDKEVWYYECRKRCFITHIECLPSVVHHEETVTSDDNGKLPNYLKEPIVRYHLPKDRPRCTNCRDAGQHLSSGSYCANCVWENLAFEMKAAIVSHRSHKKHDLSLWIRPIPQEDRNDLHDECFVCGESVDFSSYKCEDCKIKCHIGCANLPREIQHPHEGSSLAFSLVGSLEIGENVVCFVCNGSIGNQKFYKHYYCSDGELRAHPHCVAFHDPYEYGSVMDAAS